MYQKLIFILICFLFACSSKGFSPTGDKNYWIIQENDYHLIFAKDYLDSIGPIQRKIHSQFLSMPWTKKNRWNEPITIILFSNKFQISNAYASLPAPSIGLFPSGAAGLNLSTSSWFDIVFEHELNHIVQLTPTHASPWVKKLFGFPSFLFFFLISPAYPNMFLPQLITEGDSVLKESLLNKGGRLYSGRHRAFVFSQIKHYRNQVFPFSKKLLKSRRTAHSSAEKYLHGGYLLAFMSETYSQDDMDIFFQPYRTRPKKYIRQKIKRSKHTFSPPFKDVFSFQHSNLFIDYLTKAYLSHYTDQATRQKSSPSPALFESWTCPPFNRSGDEVFFLTSDFKSLPSLNIFNTKTKTWTQKKVDLPLGKVFKIGEKYYSRSAEAISPFQVHYSLFSEGKHSLKSFESQYVEDLQPPKKLYIDATHTLNELKLYHSDKFYSFVHSNALFDASGNIYYFQQKKMRRTLYKNKTPLTSYKGFYGNVLDIDSKGAVYFTGPSSYGSSVYRYKKGAVSRMTSSDTIIQAKKIGDNEFLACEVTPEGYAYKIIPLERIQQTPVLYKYDFKTSAPKKIQTSNTAKIQRGRKKAFKEAAALKTTSPIKYSPLQHIRPRGGSFSGLWNIPITRLTADFLFADDLQFHTLQIIFSSVILHPLWIPGSRSSDMFLPALYSGTIDYQNTKNRLIWDLQYSLAYIPPTQSFLHHWGTNWRWPLFQKGRWSSLLVSSKSLEKTKYILQPKWRGSWSLSYSQKFPYRYAPRKGFRFRVFLDYKQSFLSIPKEQTSIKSFIPQDLYDSTKGGFKTGATLQSVLHLGHDFYIFPELSYVRSFNTLTNPAEISLFSLSWPKNFDTLEEPTSRFLYDDTSSNSLVFNDMYRLLWASIYKAQSIMTASLAWKKAFYLSDNILNIDYITPLFQTKWVFLENPWLRLSKKNTQRLAQTTPSLMQKILDEMQQPAQWLEWTVGCEWSFLLKERWALIFGASFGVRTPIQFWKKDAQSYKLTRSILNSIATSNLSEFQSFPSSKAQFYLKMPL